MQEDLERKEKEKAEIVARAKADSRLCIECGNPPRTHKMIGCDHIMLCGGCRASLEDTLKEGIEMYAKHPHHPLGGPDVEHNVIADRINDRGHGRNCTCLICPKREIRMNPKIDELFDD